MALVLADRVRDTTTTTGTGTVTLSGTSPTGYQTFGAAIGNGNTTYYTINAGSQWEVGLGTYSSTGPTLARTTVLASSNSGSLVDFSTGTKDVFVTYPAEKSVNQDASGNVGIGTTSPVAKVDITDQNNAGFRFAEYNDVEGAVLRVSSARGTIAAPTALLTDSVIFGLRAFGYSSAGAFGSAVVQINGRAAENFTATAQGTYLTFVTTTIGSATSAERMRITDAGNVGIGTTTVNARLSLGNLVSNKVFALYDDGTNQYGMGIAGSQYRMFAATGANLCFGNYARSTDTFTETARIDSSGDVGIGTSAPAYKLDVTGQGRATTGWAVSTDGSAFTPSGLNAIPNYGTGYITSTAITTLAGFGGISAYTNQLERMRIDASGNVGIGTSSPGAKLDVAGGIISRGDGTEGGQITLNNAANSAGVYNFDVDGSGHGRVFTVTNNTNLTLGQLSGTGGIMAMYTGAAERMRIDSSGNVGIGTSTPTAKTHILTGDSPTTYTGPTSGTWAAKIGMTSNGTANNGLSVWNAWAGSGATIFEIATGFSGVTTGYFPTYSALGDGTHIWKSISGTERMRLDASGNVGIGTSAPSYKLVVSAASNTNPIAVISGSTKGLRLGADANGGILEGVDNTGAASFQPLTLGGADIRFTTSTTERMRIDSSGNVGIGTSAPAYTLDVNGDINFGTSLTSGSGVSTGDCRFELGANRSASGNAYMDFHATAGTDYEARVLRGSGTNGVLTIENLGTGGMSFYNASAADVRFYTNTAERMRIGSNGAVAIGGTGTDATLHIQQSYGGYDRLTQISPGSASKNAYNLMSARDSGNADLWWSWGVRNDNVWCFVPGVNYSMNPVTGIYFDSACAAYKPGGGTWTATSDARVKTNIAPISDAASRIMALKPSAFEYRIPEAHQGRVSDRGFIAQDFEEVYPHSVTESAVVAEAEKAFITGGDKIKAIGLNNDFFADLVALVQEQQTTIQELTARVAQLEGK